MKFLCMVEGSPLPGRRASTLLDVTSFSWLCCCFLMRQRARKALALHYTVFRLSLHSEMCECVTLCVCVSPLARIHRTVVRWLWSNIALDPSLITSPHCLSPAPGRSGWRKIAFPFNKLSPCGFLLSGRALRRLISSCWCFLCCFFFFSLSESLSLWRWW